MAASDPGLGDGERRFGCAPEAAMQFQAVISPFIMHKQPA